MQKKPTFFQKFASIFSEGSGFMSAVSKLLTLAAVNLACLLCMLPVITGGAALTALYGVLSEREGLSFDRAFRRFFQLVKLRWRASLVPWLLALVSGSSLAAAWHIVLVAGLTNRFLLMAPLMIASAAVGFMLLWLFPVLAFHSASWPQAIRTAFLLGLRELPRSLLALIPEAALLLLPLACTTLTRLGLWLFFGVAPLALCKLLLLQGPLSRISA